MRNEIERQEPQAAPVAAPVDRMAFEEYSQPLADALVARVPGLCLDEAVFMARDAIVAQVEAGTFDTRHAATPSDAVIEAARARVAERLKPREEWARGWVGAIVERCPSLSEDEALQIARAGVQREVEFCQRRGVAFDARWMDKPTASTLGAATSLHYARQIERHGDTLAQLAAGLRRDLEASGVGLDVLVAYLAAHQKRTPRRRW